MYGWIVKRLRNAEAEHTKNGEDKLALLCRDAASVVVELNTRNKTLRELLRDRDTTIDSLNVSLETYRGLTEAMQQNQQPRWIPVQERLPEEDGYYLVCCQPYKAQWVTMQHYSPDSAFSGSVTYWMPLPEPPKEDNT